MEKPNKTYTCYDADNSNDFVQIKMRKGVLLDLLRDTIERFYPDFEGRIEALMEHYGKLIDEGFFDGKVFSPYNVEEDLRVEGLFSN